MSLAGAHRFPLRVYYEDTDAGGIVYYANYLNFAERARTEMLRDAGIEQERLRRDAGIGLVVRRAAIEFLRPARLDDVLTVTTRLAGRIGATLDLAQEIARGDAVLARLDVRVACVRADGRPTRLPQALTDAIATLLGDDSTMVHTHAR
ncbi:MAG TPA: tol-pal system-associated acyl-CoA thioesterase [Stellaceae bacterium]|nr:tol-pal system-associated acyl-CoA thioesterase [Stellaceae bacterium]